MSAVFYYYIQRFKRAKKNLHEIKFLMDTIRLRGTQTTGAAMQTKYTNKVKLQFLQFDIFCHETIAISV